MHYIGLKVTKDYLDFVSLKQIETGDVRPFIVYNSPDNFGYVSDWLGSLETPSNDVHVVTVGTKYYHELIANYLCVKGVNVSIISRSQLNDFLDTCSTTYDITHDSAMLAYYGESRMPEFFIPEDKIVRDIKSEFFNYKQLMREHRRYSRRLENGSVAENEPGFVHKLKQKLTLIEHDMGVSYRKLEALIESDEKYKEDLSLLRTITGLTPESALLILAMIINHGTETARQLVSYVGLAPKNQGRKGKSSTGTTLAKNGLADERHILYDAALVCVQLNPDISVQYKRLTENGKAEMQAICAAMRKLIHLAYALLKHREAYRYFGNNR